MHKFVSKAPRHTDTQTYRHTDTQTHKQTHTHTQPTCKCLRLVLLPAALAPLPPPLESILRQTECLPTVTTRDERQRYSGRRRCYIHTSMVRHFTATGCGATVYSNTQPHRLGEHIRVGLTTTTLCAYSHHILGWLR